MSNESTFQPIQPHLLNETAFEAPISSLHKSINILLKSQKTHLSLAILSFFILLSLFGPMISGHTYFDIDLAIKNSPPCIHHWLGTDDLGRDLFTRLCFGVRISLFVGFAAALIDLVIGVSYGALSAFCSPRIDDLLMRFTDILSTIPDLLICIALTVVIGSGISSIIVAFIVIGWIPMARIVRSKIRETRHAEYVLAAKAMGAGPLYILKNHLIPSSAGPMVVTVALTVPLAIFTEAVLSFLGLGVQVPIASLGSLAHDGLTSMKYYPWRLFFPSIAIGCIILSFNMLGDTLRDAFDPKGGIQ
jgi:ABC-type dipeptide/oligopeptide/nickel transport system permease subunit